jgi:hypothetical protein
VWGLYLPKPDSCERLSQGLSFASKPRRSSSDRFGWELIAGIGPATTGYELPYVTISTVSAQTSEGTFSFQSSKATKCDRRTASLKYLAGRSSRPQYAPFHLNHRNGPIRLVRKSNPEKQFGKTTKCACPILLRRCLNTCLLNLQPACSPPR